MIGEWSITIPAPALWLNSNQRRNRRGDAPIVKAWRDVTAWRARSAKMPKLGVCRITATLHWTDRRRRDSGNYYPTIKAAIDGLVDAEVLDDDDDLHVLSLTMMRGEQVPRRPDGVQGSLTLTVREAL